MEKMHHCTRPQQHKIGSKMVTSATNRTLNNCKTGKLLWLDEWTECGWVKRWCLKRKSLSYNRVCVQAEEWPVSHIQCTKYASSIISSIKNVRFLLFHYAFMLFLLWCVFMCVCVKASTIPISRYWWARNESHVYFSFSFNPLIRFWFYADAPA